jgi:colanic acid/amylovoran biosynthesis glycosyltransferase
MKKPVIAHVTNTFFSQTGTFIYNYLVRFSNIHPICISRSSIENSDIFPFPQSDCYSIHRRAFTPVWLYLRLMRLFTGRMLELENIIRSRGARLIHAHFGPVGYIIGKSALNLQLPMVTTFYGYDLNPAIKVYRLIRGWHKYLFEYGDLFLVEGIHMRQRLVDLGCPPEKIQIQRIAVPVKEMPWRSRKAIYNRPPIILFSGRFVEKKGLLYALAAINNLKKKGTPLEFRVIGDGPQMSMIKRYIHDQNMSGYTRLLGFLNYPDHIKEMNNADIFLQPSVTAKDGDSEGGAPTTILEAQAMGLPIVSTYHCDIPNIVIPGQSALLVEERNTTDLANALGLLIENPSKWSSMSKIGRDFVKQYHDIELEVVKLEEKYFNLLNIKNDK